MLNFFQKQLKFTRQPQGRPQKLLRRTDSLDMNVCWTPFAIRRSGNFTDRQFEICIKFQAHDTLCQLSKVDTSISLKIQFMYVLLHLVHGSNPTGAI